MQQLPVSTRLLEQTIKGSPAWLDSEHYTIAAKSDGMPGREMMRGPMLQALLAVRFRLKIHRESGAIPVYELRITKGGLKVEAAKDGGCITVDRDHPPPFPVQGQPLPRVCGGWAGDAIYGTTMANLCSQISPFADRDVVDRTGITGVFDVHFDFLRADILPDQSVDGRSEPSEAAHFNAIQSSLPRLGLMLVPARAAGQFLVIDHVDRPTEN